LVDGLQRASALRELSEHKRAEQESQAFEALRSGLIAARKDEAILDGFEEQQMCDALELIAKRGLEKKMLRGRAVECLKSAFGRPAWLRAAQSRPDLLAQLRELLAETSDLLAVLEAPAPAGDPVDIFEEAPKAEAALLEKKPEVERLLTVGRTIMRQFDWQFPDDPLGTKLDQATQGFQSFFDGVTRLTTSTGKASLEVGVSEFLQSFQSDWPGILQFSVSMYRSGKRNVYRSRIKFVVVKLREMAPGFGEVLANLEGGLPWPTTPCSSFAGPPGEASSLLGAAAAAPATVASAASGGTPSSAASLPSSAPPPPPPPPLRHGVVWIDFKASAYKSSFLADEASVELMGFHDDEAAQDYAPRERWLEYILERIEDPARRVAVVIMNRKHLQAVKDIRAFCAEGGHEPPKFLVCTRGRPEEFVEWGVDPGCVTQDWVRAAELAMEEVKRLR